MEEVLSYEKKAQKCIWLKEKAGADDWPIDIWT